MSNEETTLPIFPTREDWRFVKVAMMLLGVMLLLPIVDGLAWMVRGVRRVF